MTAPEHDDRDQQGGGLSDAEREALVDVLGAELYEALMESSADQWRRWRYLTDFAKEQYRAEAERIILGAFMPAVERIVAAREARAEIQGQMKHITAEVARGDQPLDEKEEVIADLRARLSHAESERDDAQAAADRARAEVTAAVEMVAGEMSAAAYLTVTSALASSAPTPRREAAVMLTRNQVDDLRRWLGMALGDGVTLRDSAANEGRRIVAELHRAAAIADQDGAT